MKPFEFEPEYSSDEERPISSDDEKSEAKVPSSQRVGNNDWCDCGGVCRVMGTATESYCCRDTCEIPDDYFEGSYIKPRALKRSLPSSSQPKRVSFTNFIYK